MSFAARLRALAPDLAPWRASADLRRVAAGEWVSGVGTQATLVALPYQVYVATGSTFRTGLLGAAELLPLVLSALYAGVLADRIDRRRLVLGSEAVVVLMSAVLAAATLSHRAPLALLYVASGVLAGGGAVQSTGLNAMVPNLVSRAHLPAALAATYGLFQLSMVVGPAIGGLLIPVAGVGAIYLINAASCAALMASCLRIRPQVARGRVAHPGTWAALRESLGFVRRTRTLAGSWAIDIAAMTFGMPRALFPALAIGVYHAGARGTGLLFAALAAGATVAALGTGWVQRTRRLGRVVIAAVLVWGIAIASAGAATSLWVGVAAVAAAGAADSVSAVARSIINQTVTPDALRGRMSGLFGIAVASGPRLGDLQSGTVGGLLGARTAIATGGLACVVAGVALAVALPDLARFDLAENEAELSRAAPS